jgi:predicted nucleic acid-binding protein
MRRLFADTFFFFAFLNADDLAHGQAVRLSEDPTIKMVTTAWVLTELADGLARVEDRQMFVEFYGELRNDTRVTILSPSHELFVEGIRLYASRADKEWSLTDCISFTVMHREGLAEALTGDRHFEQAGFHALLIGR